MDCLEGMKQLPDNSIDMILCDLPYGTTACKWDTIIPLEKLWMQYKRISKDDTAIVLTASQPFTTDLINSNRELFKYCLVWDKVLHSNPLLSKIQPLRVHEDIVVFYKKQSTYNPQKNIGKKRRKEKPHFSETKGETIITAKGNKGGFHNPITIITFSNANKNKIYHPTQKPLKLFEYLIKTYSDEGDVVLDNCMGSGTTAVACKRLNRHYIGFEISSEYCDIAQKRLDNVPMRLEKFIEG